MHTGRGAPGFPGLGMGKAASPAEQLCVPADCAPSTGTG